MNVLKEWIALIKTMMNLLKIIIGWLLILFLLFMLWGEIFLCPGFLNKGYCGCSPTMPGPCPDNWDPINECIKGEDEDCPGKVLYNCKEIPEGSWRCD